MYKRLLLLAVLTTAAFALLLAARQRPVRVATPPLVAGPTFNREIVHIFREHCQTCHHPGDIAPFSLMTYADAAPRAKDIKFMTGLRLMPPWKATAGCGEFTQARVLTDEQISLLARWADNGAPEGNPADLPAPLQFDGGWALGAPDAVFANNEPYTPTSARDEYRCFTIPSNTTSERFVDAIDVRPGDRKTVHHVLAFLDTGSASVTLDQNDPGPGYTCFGGPGFNNPGALGGWAPGARPQRLPAGIAMSLPANSRIVMQVHYNPHSGTPGPDQTEIGVYYAKEKPSKVLRILPIVNQEFTIPPGDANYKVTGKLLSSQLDIPLPFDAHVWWAAPHMHLLGRRMNVAATLPNGSTTCLINIDDWDFNWQGQYFYKNGVPLVAGTKLHLTAYFDNSADNPRNPNSPPKPVSWGEETTDEMALAFVGVTFDSENLSKGQRSDTRWMEGHTLRATPRTPSP